MITVNIDKAKDITKERLREERAPLLATQDVAYMRAIENNQDVSAVVAEKQRLRDITLLVEQAQTIDELKALSV